MTASNATMPFPARLKAELKLDPVLLDIFRKPRRGKVREVVRRSLGKQDKPSRVSSSSEAVASTPAKARGDR